MSKVNIVIQTKEPCKETSTLKYFYPREGGRAGGRVRISHSANLLPLQCRILGCTGWHVTSGCQGLFPAPRGRGCLPLSKMASERIRGKGLNLGLWGGQTLLSNLPTIAQYVCTADRHFEEVTLELFCPWSCRFSRQTYSRRWT